MRQRAPSSLLPNEILQRTEVLDLECDAAIAKLSGKKGMLAVLQGIGTKSSDGSSHNKLHAKTPGIIADLKRHEEDANTLKAKIKDVQPDDIIALETSCAQAHQEVDKVVQVASDHNDALTHLQDAEKKKSRAQYLHDRHQAAKFASYMTAQQHPKALGKLMGNRLYNLNYGVSGQTLAFCDNPDFKVNTTEVDGDTVGIWTEGKKCPIADAVWAAVEAAKADGAVGH